MISALQHLAGWETGPRFAGNYTVPDSEYRCGKFDIGNLTMQTRRSQEATVREPFCILVNEGIFIFMSKTRFTREVLLVTLSFPQVGCKTFHLRFNAIIFEARMI